MSAPRRSAPTAPGGPVIAVIGRPNVGKSTLVNRLVGRREAIVQEQPGVTRDRTAHAAEWRGEPFEVLDTGGWLPGWATQDELTAAVSAQAERGTEDADLVLFVVDAGVGVTEEDAAVAQWLRARQLPVVLVANKADQLADPRHPAAELAELYALGVGDPVPVSALHGLGSGDLLDEVFTRLRASDAFTARRADSADEVPGVALIGRPNVGKSSLFNRLVGEERVLVDPRPGTTRDAVDTIVEAAGRRYRFVDTAGLRRRARLRQAEPTEYYSSVRTVQALDRAAVALLVLDASDTISEADQKLARRVLEAGRALVLVLNKWDLTDEHRRREVERELDRLLGFVAFAPLVRTAAVTGRGVGRLLPQIDRVLEAWSQRIPTATLNEWLADAVAATPPPLHGHHPVRLRYITQPAVGPPRFRVFANAQVPPGYVRYLERRLREAFGFEGTPLDVQVRVRPRWEERVSRSRGPRSPG